MLRSLRKRSQRRHAHGWPTSTAAATPLQTGKPSAPRCLPLRRPALDGTLATFRAAGLVAEPGAVERLSELRRLRDEAQAEVDRHSDAADLVISADVDWHRLTVGEQQALVQAVISSATVLPSSSKWRTDGQAERLEITFRA